MTKYTSPADVIAAIAEERRLTEARRNAEMDVRIAARDGDETAVNAAKAAEAASLQEWHKSYIAAKEAVRAALDAVGLDPATIKPYL